MKSGTLLLVFVFAGVILSPVHSQDKELSVEGKAAVSDKYIDSLIDKLGNEDEWERENGLRKLKEVGESAFRRIVEYGLKGSYHPAAVSRLLNALGDIHTTESRTVIQKYLKSNIAEIRVAAMGAIDKFGEERLIYDLMPMMNSENEMVRRKAVLILGKYGFKSSVKGLCDLLDDPFPHIKIIALQELRAYPEMKDMIIEKVVKLLDMPYPHVALEAAVTLKSFDDERGEDFFKEVLKQKDSFFKEEAIEYAGKYKVESAVHFLIKMLKSDNWYQRYIAVDALGKIKHPLAIPSLKVLFEEEKIDAVRIALARIFFEYKHPDTLGILEHKVSSEKDTNVRWFIVATIGEIGTDKAIGPLIVGLLDSEEKIRLAAVISLRKITGENFDYDHRARRDERAEAIRSWQQWYQREKKGD